MGRQQRTVGAIVEIKLRNNLYSYGRILDKANFAIYDILTEETLSINEIVKRPVLFIVAVQNDAVTTGRWRKIGKLPLEKNLLSLPMKFIQDGLVPNIFKLYDPNTGKTIKATKEDCLGLERAAVWEAKQVEDRIRDYHDEKPNRWLKNMNQH